MNGKKIKIAIFFLIVFIFSILFSLINIGNEKIHNNISIQQINIAGMSQSEAEEVLNKNLREKNINQIKLKHNDYEMTLSYEQLNVNYDISNAIEKAYGTGRTGNIITNNYSILFGYFFKNDIPLNVEIDEDALNNAINDLESKLPDVKTEGSYYVDGESLVIKKRKKRCNSKEGRAKK